ncbi:MAG TPA: AI-2E family transporter [Gemmatimonadaceae bacterium]|nr:AI-2E family transporter [Gemmatimonadaceae bacterium]
MTQRTDEGIAPERRRRVPGWQSRDILRTGALLAGLWIFMKLVWFAHPLLLTVFLGVLFGLAVEGGVDRLVRFRIPRGVGAALIVVAFFAFLFGLGMWMAPTLREQGRELRTRLPQAIDKVEAWFNERRQGMFGLILGGSEVAQGPQTPAGETTGGRTDTVVIVVDTNAVARPAQPQAQPEQARGDTGAVAAAQRADGPLSDRLGRQVSGVAKYLFPFLSSTFAVFAGIILIVFLAIYIAAEPDVYHAGLMHLFPHHARKRAGEVLSAMATVLRKWLVTQLIAMLVIGTITTIILLLLDVKAAFALGAIAGLLEFVPTIGPLLSAIPAVAMGFLDSPDKALAVAIAYGAIQFLENHLLIPLLMKGGVNIPPALTVVSQALMALLFGFLGLMVAVPLLAAILVPVKMLYVEGVVGDDMDVLPEEEHEAKEAPASAT